MIFYLFSSPNMKQKVRFHATPPDTVTVIKAAETFQLLGLICKEIPTHPKLHGIVYS